MATYSHRMPAQASAPDMGAGAPDAGMEAENPGQGDEYEDHTFEMPSKCFEGGTPQPGAMFQCKVVNADENSGTVTAEIMEQPQAQGKGIQQAAGEFNPPQEGM